MSLPGCSSLIVTCRASLAYLGMPLRQVEAAFPSSEFRKLIAGKIDEFWLMFTL